MDNSLFDDLVASIKEAGAIKRNEIKASRVTELELPDIKEVREKTGLDEFLLHYFILDYLIWLSFLLICYLYLKKRKNRV